LTDAAPQGFGGYCPVTWSSSGELVRGQAAWGCIHRGKLYLFASEAKRDQFRLDPDRLSPGLAGFDPVTYADEGSLVEGSLDHQVVLEADGVRTIYLFSSQNHRERFEQDPERYVAEVRQAMRTADAAR
jgi:YHS domain-containing protein